ncbi:hypothetical protein KP509_1Z020200, partial [Ceratopteris richardii]
IQKQTILSRDAESLRLKKPCKKLTFGKKSINGRNNTGTITSRHRGGAHKRLYHKIDFRRDKFNIDGRIASIEYDPNCNASICLVNYIDGEKRYILYVRGIKVGDNITSGPDACISVGNALPLSVVRAAGEAAKEGRLAKLRLPSSELRLVSQDCLARSKRWLGKRPTVRGSAMNPIDHPHGGGQGRTSIGRKRPSTPWGHAALGKKNHGKKCRNPLILRRRRST